MNTIYTVKRRVLTPGSLGDTARNLKKYYNVLCLKNGGLTHVIAYRTRIVLNEEQE